MVRLSFFDPYSFTRTPALCVSLKTEAFSFARSFGEAESPTRQSGRKSYLVTHRANKKCLLRRPTQ